MLIMETQEPANWFHEYYVRVFLSIQTQLIPAIVLLALQIQWQSR